MTSARPRRSGTGSAKRGVSCVRRGELMVADSGEASHLAPGMALSRVTLPATDGTDVCVATLPGRSLVMVYPWTGRPGVPNPPDWDDILGAHGSTPELKGFRDGARLFAARDITLFGLSRQSTHYQRELVERLRLPFPILSDADGAFAGALRLPTSQPVAKPI
ncbi:MAG: redoxin family protein [Hyphomicrobiales bacterium]